MKWIELAVHTTHQYQELVELTLNDNGTNGVTIEDSREIWVERDDQFGTIYELKGDDYPQEGVTIKGYLSEVNFNDTVLEKIETELAHFINEEGGFSITFTEMDEEDWANEWKNYFHPIRVTERFTIVPSWEDYQSDSEDEIQIELDPGMAFGTGTHATTRLCLAAIEKYYMPYHSLIDVGTGSGILAIAAKKIGVPEVAALDLDNMAVQVAKENFEKNNVLDKIDVFTGNLLQGQTEKKDIIVANILAHIIEQMIDDAYRLLNDKGLFITSGIIESKAPEIISQLKQVGFTIIDTQIEEEWVVIIAQK